mgnify:CR=1 FL=1
MARPNHLRAVATSASAIDLRIKGKVPPHDLDAEAAVLSAVMNKNDLLPRVLEIIDAKDCYSDANKLLLETIEKLVAAGVPVDLVTLVSELRARERLQQVGGPAYVAQIYDASPAVANVEAHARIIAEHAKQRRYLEELWLQIADAYEPPVPGSVWRDQGAERLNKLAASSERCTSVTIAAGAAAALQKLGEREEGGIIGLPTGFVGLDSATAGLQDREVTLLGGPSGKGKTAFAHCVALACASNEARTKRGVIIFNLDNMTADECALRINCARGRVDSIKLKTGAAQPYDWQRYTAASAEVAQLPILFECHASLTPLAFRAKIRSGIRELRRRFGVELGLVVGDYFQLFTPDDGGPGDRDMNQEQKFNRNAKSFLRTAALFNVPILMLVQLNKAEEVRDCAAAAMHAQNRWTLTRKAASKRATPPGYAYTSAETATIKIAKGRNAREEAVEMRFYPQFTLFTEEEL